MPDSHKSSEFSFKSRARAFQRFRDEQFDLLVVGGGITGAAVARDAATRGLKVALVERGDFAGGTSSASSKLVHGGLRYLENFEFKLVFEALAERARLLRSAPNMVRPLPFYFPVYEGDPHGRGILSLGLWLYDLLALMRTPGMHRGLSRRKLLAAIPFLKPEGLTGGFRYFDASMWDDVLAIETLRSAHLEHAAIANYTEALGPRWVKDRIAGFRVRDLEGAPGKQEFDIRAHRVVICAGPWTDLVGGSLSASWRPWLNPSKGVHLVFDHRRIPVPGAMVMSHPEDGRIAFVIPRPDLGAGVTIVGTTDSPSPADPGRVGVEPADVTYLMKLLDRYFPTLQLTASDIVSSYVGVRPLFHDQGAGGKLQKVSREHHIDLGPGGAVVVAGGKYTTHRTMAAEIVEFALAAWRKDAREGKTPELPFSLKPSGTQAPVNPAALPLAVEQCRQEAIHRGLSIPEPLIARYGADALAILELDAENRDAARATDPDGFPFIEAQLRHAIRTEMAMRLEDFYLRRMPLFLARADHGLPWAERLAKIWAEERGLELVAASAEEARLRTEIARREAWIRDPSAHSSADRNERTGEILV